MDSNDTGYEEKIRARLREGQAEMEKLKAKMDQKKAGAKVEYQRRLENLEQRRASLESKLEELSQASGAALKELKAGVSDAWDRFSDALANARKEFN